jgi:hypothetical protein
LAKDWAVAYRRVADVLSGVVRASRVVEGMNSVVRLHQARQRRWTQGLLGFEAALWELPSVRVRQAKERFALPTFGAGLTHERLVDTAPHRS